MKLNEKEKKGVLVLALLFVVYTLIVLAVPFAKGGMFWLTYLFTAVAFGVQAYVFKLSFEKEAGAKSKFYGFPIARVGVLYLAVQIVLGWYLWRWLRWFPSGWHWCCISHCWLLPLLA